MCVCVCLCAVPVNFPRGQFHYYLKSGLGMAIGWSASFALGTILNVLVFAFNCIFDKQLLTSTSSYLILCFWQIPTLAQRGSYCSGGDRTTFANQLCMRWVSLGHDSCQEEKKEKKQLAPGNRASSLSCLLLLRCLMFTDVY